MNVSKKVDRVTVLLLALVILVPTAAWSGYQFAVHAGGAISGITYGPGDIDSYSYMVFRDGLNYYAKNGTTRVVEFGPSTNASDVINDVIAAVPTNIGGVIVLNGQFNLTAPIRAVGRYGITLKGFGQTIWHSDHDVPKYYYPTELRNTNALGALINLTGCEFWEIRDMGLIGDNGHYGLQLINSAYNKFEHLLFQNFTQSIRATGTSWSNIFNMITSGYETRTEVSYSFYGSGTLHQTTFSNCLLQRVYINFGFAINFYGNYFTRNGQIANEELVVQFQYSTGAFVGNSWDISGFSLAGTRLLYVYRSLGVTIQGNNFPIVSSSGTQTYFVLLTETNGTVIQGNRFANTTNTITNSYGITITTTCYNITQSANTFIGFDSGRSVYDDSH